MPLTLIPDIEKVVARYLREHEDLVTLGARVVGKTPDDTSTPWIKVTQLDGNQVDIADRLVSYLLQLDCYAGATGGQPEANLLARTVRAALNQATGVRQDTVITGTRISGDARIPETADFEPARERRVISVEVWAHS